jgi:hypothetical protein
MKVREFFNHLQRINNEEIPHLPPFRGDAQKLADDEIIEIILYGIPKSWKNEMTRQGFDPLNTGLGSMLEFCERQEEIPPDEFKTVKAPQAQTQAPKANKKPKGNYKFCLKHGRCAHTTDECEDIKAALANNGGKPNTNGYSKQPYKNKTWTSQAQQAKTNQQSMYSMVKRAVREIASNPPKRKAKGDAFMVDGPEHGEVVDLSDFNYAEMDNLKIESDDAIPKRKEICRKIESSARMRLEN